MSEALTTNNLEPQLPPGDISAISTLSQSFSFHSSPESFISTRAQSLSSKPERDEDQPTSSPLPQIVRARILNRNVAVISSHQICKDVLGFGSGAAQQSFRAATLGESIRPDAFTVNAAYRQLMSDFFPPPNILLVDPPAHVVKRQAWNEQLSSLPVDSASTIRDIANEHFNSWSDGEVVDIYESMKDLSWRLLLDIFLQLSPSNKSYSTIEKLQETLLRGQFSLFPVALNTLFWRSPRSKGIQARQSLQKLLREHVSTMDSSCPFLNHGKVDQNEVSSNVLLFTSSVAVKALSSILTASLLNLFLFPSTPPLNSRVRSEQPANQEALLNSILLETERLSPPVVGVMRRLHQDLVFTSPRGLAPILVPSGWDVWLYFVGAGRDSTVYTLPDTFVPERFVATEETKPGFSFGAGAKSCLGRDLVRQIVKSVAESALAKGFELEGSVEAEGVRGWLGWETGISPSAFARDLKQLPCQRPRGAIKVRVLL